ncbi:hypothetical protein [Myroides odoratimimus]|uniref:hypothetical protein n=1 Tax=Myroides odoratimimus TaxID=76832 RepID=UPI003101241A
MKKKIIPLFVLFGTMSLYAQTGIGTPLPHGAAELEVSSNNKGMLIPRLELKSETDKTTITGGDYPTGLMVYHTGNTTLEAGFYFWSNAKWNALVSNSTLYKYIKETAQDGNVSITNEGDNNFTFKWIDKSTKEEKEVSISDLVKEFETVTTLAPGTGTEKAILVYKNEDSTTPDTEIDLTKLLKDSKEFNEFLKVFVSSASITETETSIIAEMNGTKKTGVYKYYNEKRADSNYEPVEITVVDDVVNNFETIANNPTFKKELNKYFTTNPPAGGTVTYTFENNKHIFNYTDKDGNPQTLDMSKVVKDYETLTTITSDTKGTYTYKNEAGTDVKITVVDDVANNFDTIVKNQKFKDVINNYLKDNAEGNVTYEGDKFYFVKNEGGTITKELIDLSTLIEETDTPITATLKDVGGKDVRTGEYKYKSEKGTEITINVTEDVANNFGDVINNEDVKKIFNDYFTANPPAGGTVTYKLDGGNHIFNYTDKDGKPQVLNMSKVVKDYETLTTIVSDAKGTYTYKNEAGTDVKITVVDDVANNFDTIVKNQKFKDVINNYLKDNAEGNVTYEGGKFYFVKKDGDTITKELIDLSTLIEETDTPITATLKDVGGKDVRTGEYKYKSEKGTEITINVTEDVANNFGDIINNEEFKKVFDTYLTENVEGNVTYEGGKFYYTIKNGDTYEQKEVSIEEIIKDNSYLSSLVLTNATNADNVKGVFTFNDGKAGSTSVEFAETLTSITKGTENGKQGNYIAYNYKDETGANDATTQITVTSDVINSFSEIIKDPTVNNSLSAFISGATGSVTVSKNGNGDVIIGYKEDNKPVTVNLTELIAEKQTETSIIAVMNGTKKTGAYKYYNEKRADSNYEPVEITVVGDVMNNFEDIINNEDVKKIFNDYFTTNPPAGGTVTYTFENDKHIFNYTDKDGNPQTLDMSKVVKDYETLTTITSDTKGTYTYKNEAGTDVKITVVDDVANNFDTIVKNQKFKDVINNYLKDNAEGNVTYEGDKFYFVKNEGGTITKELIDLSTLIEETDTPITATLKDVGGKDVRTGEYKYKSEKGTEITINVTEDVANNFGDVINNEDVKKIFNDYFTANPPAGGTVTYTFENNKHIFNYTDKDGNPQTLDMSSIVKEYETKTAVTKFDATGAQVENSAKPADGFTYYKYDNETPEARYISVSEDVSNDFATIVNTGTNKTIIENIAKDVAGPGAVSSMKVTPAAENADEVKAGFTFNNGKAGEADVKFAETLTNIALEKYKVFVYKEVNAQGEEEVTYVYDNALTDPGNKVLHDTYEANKIVYENEKGELVEVKGSDLMRQIKQGENPDPNGGLETLTSLLFIENYKENGPCLVYVDELKQESFIRIGDMFKQSETITTLEIDNTNRQITYTNETGIPKTDTFDDLVQEPWYVAKTSTNDVAKQATKNNQDIYTQGWVGIGYDKKSPNADNINEKLRVNGSITATNSYYADYVFESYFEGYSNLKYDYKFNDLSSVSDFIASNRHLPGITPISDLEKTETGYSFNVSELSIQLLEKTEELFLHVIEQQKELDAKEGRIEELESEISDMAKRLEALEALLTK